MKDKAPADVYEWVEDYSAEMAATSPNDVISSSSWALTNGLVLDSNTKTGTTTTAWISGGRAYTYAEATNRIITTAGRTYNKTIVFDVKPQICD